MRIQELCQSQTPENREQTKCSTMTEEGHTRIGMNGSIDGGGSSTVGATGVQSDSDQHGATASGGRLKFFKDGKFILELARTREGERNMWVSVPRKTFWHLPTSAGTIPSSHRQESSTSLSVSDDNSSVQSSPWQRDHSWKQSTPRCNVSSEMTFFYRRPTTLLRQKSRSILRKRRRPFDISCSMLKNVSEGDVTSRLDGSVQSESAATAHPVAAVAEEESDKKFENGQTQEKKIVPLAKERRKLSDIVRTLSEKKKHISNNTVPGLKAVISSSRHEQMVSPRKRILREFERVTIDDLSNKRSRAKTTQQNTNLAAGSSPRRAHNGSTESTPVQTKNSSSYSITSLLGHRVREDEPPSPGPPSEHNRSSTQMSPGIQHAAINNMPSPKSVTNYSSKISSHYSDQPDLSSSPEYCRFISQNQNTMVHGSPTHTLSPPPDIYKTGAPPPYHRSHESPNHIRHHHHRQQQNLFSSPLQGLVGHQKSPQYYSPSNSHGCTPSSPHSADERFVSPSDKTERSAVRRSSPKGFLETKSPPKTFTETIPSGIGPPSAGYACVPPYVYHSPGAAYVPHPVAFYGATYRNPYIMPYTLDPTARSSSPHYRPPIVAAHAWTSLSQVHAQDTLRDDISSDMPLNLSKHA